MTPIGAGDGNLIVGDSQDPLVLQVRSDCEWTLRLEAVPTISLHMTAETDVQPAIAPPPPRHLPAPSS